MTTRSYVYAEQLTQSSGNTTSTPADHLSLTIPSADASSSTWAIFYSAMHNNATDTTNQSMARLYHSTASTSLSESRQVPIATSQWMCLSGCIPITFGASPGDQTFKLQYNNNAGAASVSMRDATIFAIKLGANDSTVSAAASSSSSSATFGTKCDWTAPATATYDLFFCATLRVSAVLRTPIFRILLADGTTTAWVTSSTLQLATSSDYMSVAAHLRVSATAGDHIKSQFNSNTGAASTSCQDAYIVAFRVSDMENAYMAQDLTTRTTTSTSYVQRNAASDLTFTPASAVDHFAFGAMSVYGGAGVPRQARSLFTGTEYSEARSTNSTGSSYSFLSLRRYASMAASSSTFAWEMLGSASTATSVAATMGAWQLVPSASPISQDAQIAALTLAGIAGTPSGSGTATVTAQKATLTLAALAGAQSTALRAQIAQLTLAAFARPPFIGAVPATVVEMAFGADPLDPSPTWTDVTEWFRSVRGMHAARGRSSERDRYQGSMTLVLANEDRRFDPTYTPGPYYGNLRPRTPVRVTATWDAFTYPIFRGFASGFSQDYSPGGIAEVPIACYDALAALSNLPLGTYYDLHIKSKTPVARWPLGVAGSVWPEVAGKYIGYLDGDMRASGDPVTVGDPSSGYMQPSTHFGGFSKGSTKGTVWAALGRPITFTICGWFRTEQASPTIGSLRVIYNEASNRASNNTRIGVDSTGALYYYGADYVPSAIAKARSTVLVNDGNWHQFTIVHDALDRLEVYIDGADRTSLIEMEGGNILLDEPLAIGFKTGINPDYPFIGDIAEVAIFDYAFSADEVAELYQAGAAPLDGATTAEHLDALLDALGWPAALTDLTTRGKECGPAPWVGTDALTVAQKLEDTEQGALFVSRDGKVTLLDRYWWLNDLAGTTSQATFTDDWFDSDAAFYETFGFDYDDRFITNAASVTVNGDGTPVEYRDEASTDAYGVLPLSLSTLSRSAFEAMDLAVFRVTRDKDPVLRSRPFLITPQGRPDDFWPQVLKLELGHRVTLERSPQELGDTITQDVAIDSITWDISPGLWQVTFQGSQAFLLPDYWRLGTSQLGIDNTLGY